MNLTTYLALTLAAVSSSKRNRFSVMMTCAALAPGLVQAATPGDKTEHEFMENSQIICEYEASKRGQVDGGKLRYCLANHRRWYAELATLNATYPRGFYIEFAYPYCYGRGTKRGVSDVGTIALCLRTEVDAFEDVIYYVGQYGEDHVMPIVERSMVQYGSWNMARHFVRQEFDPRP